ncbi:trichohyalin-like [Macrobrachium rosenbergii]|uniref:trichohyalin-like n=1 Tax=Macrobrachium rosenbergii TaxID=79674 RepID=UPI0034D49580
MADSLDLDIIVGKSSSFGASDFAVAIPGMALLAGLAFAAHRIYTLAGRRDQDLANGMDVNTGETVIIEDSTDLEDHEDIEDDSDLDSEEILSGSPKMEQLYETDDYLNTDYDETDDDLSADFDENDDDLRTDFDEVLRLEDNLETGPLDETDEDLNTEKDLSRLNEDVRKALVEKEKEVDLLKESLALRTKELEEGQKKGEIMKRRLMETEEANITLQENLRLAEADNESILEDVLIIQDKHQALQSLLSQAESLMALGNKLLDNERATNRLLEAELQVLENGLAKLRAEKAKLDEELDEQELDIICLEKALKNEKKKNNVLQPALHRGKEMENLLERAKEREKEMQASLRSLEEELKKKNLQIEDFFKTKREVKCEEVGLQDKLDVALQHGKELERMLKEAEERERKIANDLEEKVQNRDDHIQDLLGQEKTLKSEIEALRTKLENTVSHGEKRFEKKYLRKKREEEERFRQTVYWMQQFWQRDDEVKKLRKEEEDRREQMQEMETILTNLREENQKLLRTVEEQVNKNHLLVKEEEDAKTEMRKHHQETLRQKDKEAEKQREREEELLNNLESTLRQEQNLKRLLECKEEDIVSLKQRESESQQEVQQLVKDYEMLKEKCETQEENRLREEKSASRRS